MEAKIPTMRSTFLAMFCFLVIIALRIILSDDAGLVGFENLAVGFVGAERLVARQQEVAGETVLHGNNVTDLAQLLDAFEQDNLHVFALLTSRGRAAGPGGGRA